MVSVARPEGSANSASPPDPHARTSRGKQRFIQVTLDQLAIPDPPRGTVPDGEHLTGLERRVLYGLLKWCWGGRPCIASDLEIADAIGLAGSKGARKRRVQIALNGRTKAGIKHPGMADPDRAWITIRPHENPTTGRTIEVNPKYLNWTQIRVHQGSSDAAPNEPGLTTPMSPGSLPLRAHDHYPSEPGLTPLSKDSKDSVRPEETFNVVGSPGTEITEEHPDSRPPSVIPVSFPPAPPDGQADPAAELVETFRRWADDSGNPCRDLAIAGLRRLEVPTGAPATAARPAADRPRGERPSEEELELTVGRSYVRSAPLAQAGEFLSRLQSRTDWRAMLRADGSAELVKSHVGASELDPEWARAFGYLEPEIADILAQAKADAEAKARATEPGPEANPGPGSASTAGRPRRVKDPAEVRRLIGQVRGAPDDALSRQLAERLAGPTGFNDKNRELSARTYCGLLEHLRRGELTDDQVQAAFEAACRRGVRTPGALFTDMVLDALEANGFLGRAPR